MSPFRHGKTFAALTATVLLVAGISGCNSRYGASLDRPDDPIVLIGAQLPKLLGTAPRHVVGFSWDGSAWHQVPVQVDERDLVSPGVVYHLQTSNYPTLFGTSTPLQLDRTFANVTDAQQLLLPASLDQLFALSGAVGSILPADLTGAIDRAMRSGTDVMRELARQRPTIFQGFTDALEESRKP